MPHHVDGACDRDRGSRDFPEGLTGYWAPATAQIAEVEQQIDAVVNKEVDDLGRGSTPRRYRRQYAGFYRNGQRVIYVNAIGDWSDSWRTRMVNICDGSTISFGAVYNPAAGRFDWFMFNGPFNGHKRPGPR